MNAKLLNSKHKDQSLDLVHMCLFEVLTISLILKILNTEIVACVQPLSSDLYLIKIIM